MANGHILQKISAVSSLMLARGPEREVSKRWLFRGGSRLDRQFKSSSNYSVSNCGEYEQIAVGKEVFLWPAGLPIASALQILSEILTPTHPHQYLYGPTQISPEDIVMDIGACEGSFAAVVTGRCKRVIVVEPSRTMCRLIEELFRVRQQPCPLIANCLLGSEPSTAFFVENTSNPGASRISAEPVNGAYEIPIKTLDQLVEEFQMKPTFIKCDAEGAAFQIFSGGKKLLQESHPKIASASYHSVSEYPQMYDLLKSLGYKITGKGFLFSQDKLRVQMIHAW